MNGSAIAVIGALPWMVTPVVTALRVRRSRSLDGESGNPPPDAPRVSVVIPARNEGHNIERCVRSVLASDYPQLEVIVVDDQSTDGTGDIARSIADAEPRLRVVEAGAVPEGWFGKQWACETGARASHGEIILFADADTSQSPDLVTRSVNAMRRRHADLFSVMGKQELGTFWERLIQPQIFAMLLVRYGGTESITRSRFVTNKIANGQCLLVRRSAYEELGGHALVKSHVADDMMMAQRFFARGKSVVMMEGLGQLSTRMYTSLDELVSGWRKNAFAGGRDSLPFGRLGRILFPVLLLSGPLFNLAPVLVLLASLVFDVPSALVLWAMISQIAMLAWWVAMYARMHQSPLYALISPLGAAVVLYIFLGAAVRGQHVVWKGREYVSS